VGAAGLHRLRGTQALGELVDGEEVFDVAVAAGRVRAFVDDGLPEESRRASVLVVVRDLVDAAEADDSARCEKRWASRLKLSLPEITKSSAKISFIPPCSRSSIFWKAASLTFLLSSSIQRAMPNTVLNASRLCACTKASRRPAMILCSVYQGTPANGRPARESINGAAPSGNATTRPSPRFFWHSWSSATQ
jgi:hypothetical protein